MTGHYIYIACPYTVGDRTINVLRCIQAADDIARTGHIPFAPLLFHYWDRRIPHSYEFWIDQSMAWLYRCDILVRLPGESAGADKEVEAAFNRNMKVYYGLGDLFRGFKEELKNVRLNQTRWPNPSTPDDCRGSAGQG